MKIKVVYLVCCILCSLSVFAQSYEEIQTRHYEEVKTYFEQQKAREEAQKESIPEPVTEAIFLQSQTIPAYYLEVTFDKTVHLIFPSGVSYIDLGSSNIIAGKADGSGNVVRVKAAVRDFESETNMSVITEEGSFYSFNVVYRDVPLSLNIDMADFLRNLNPRGLNRTEVMQDKYGEHSPRFIQKVMEGIYYGNKRIVKHIGSRKFDIRFLLKSIYTSEGMIFLHTEIWNNSHVPFDIDFIRLKVVDKKLAKRTAIQETTLRPVDMYNEVTQIGGRRTERTVIAIPRLIIPGNKRLVVELQEKEGGRNQRFYIEQEDLVNAETIANLTMR